MKPRDFLPRIAYMLIGAIAFNLICGGTAVRPTAAAIEMAPLVDQLSSLSLLEAQALIAKLEERWGVKANGMVVVAGPGQVPPPAAEPPEEQTEFDVELIAYGENKIAVIKAIRELTGLGLKESKDLVEAAPTIVKRQLPKAEAERVRKRLEEAGALTAVK